MSDTRPEVSKKNKYWISKHRYYELKHFCMQYPEWQRHIKVLDGMMTGSVIDISREKQRRGSSVEQFVEEREFYENCIKMVEDAAENTDPELAPYILRGVIWGLSYDVMNANKPIPCSRDSYYELYRKFFWTLNSARR